MRTLLETKSDFPMNHPNYWEEVIYEEDGRYYLHGMGGINTNYAEVGADYVSTGECTVELTKEQVDDALKKFS